MPLRLARATRQDYMPRRRTSATRGSSPIGRGPSDCRTGRACHGEEAQVRIVSFSVDADELVRLDALLGRRAAPVAKCSAGVSRVFASQALWTRQALSEASRIHAKPQSSRRSAQARVSWGRCGPSQLHQTESRAHRLGYGRPPGGEPFSGATVTVRHQRESASNSGVRR